MAQPLHRLGGPRGLRSRRLLRLVLPLPCRRLEVPVIDSVSVAQIFASLMGCWALGFSLGKSVAWTRKLGGVA